MSIHAGTILHIGGNNVIDRVQSAGLGDVRVTNDVIREVGNPEVVDKVPQDPSFTFTIESLDVSTELEAWITGKVGAGLGSAQAPGATDPDGTEYKWGDCKFVNVPSPWKDPTSSAGNVTAGHLVPSYYPTRVRYRFGVTDNATEEVELGGGSYYYGDGSPREQFATGNGATTAFATVDPAIPHRIGGSTGSTFRSIFGVIVDGQPMIDGVDYTQAPSGSAAPAVATVTFATAPASGADIRFSYFANVADQFPQSRHASTVTKPGAVRGRNICVFVGSGGQRVRLGSVQGFELEATVEGEFEREFCNVETIGYTINGRDATGSVTIRSKDADAFLSVVSKVTGVSKTEVIGWLNTNDIPLEVQIQNPKNPAQILKTLYVKDAIFQVPGTPARVNTPTDFVFGWESRSGTYSAFKGAKP